MHGSTFSSHTKYVRRECIFLCNINNACSIPTEIMEKPDKPLFEIHLKTYTDETSNMFIVPRKDGRILDLDGKEIMTENYARRQSHSM